MANIIDGKAVSAQVKEEIRQEVEALKAKGVEIGLAVVIVGDDPASQVYVKNKEKACETVGFNSYKYALQEYCVGAVWQCRYERQIEHPGKCWL